MGYLNSTDKTDNEITKKKYWHEKNDIKFDKKVNEQNQIHQQNVKPA